MDCEKMKDEKRITESVFFQRSEGFGEGFEDWIRSSKNAKNEKKITESDIIEMLNVNVEKDYTESEINEMYSRLKTMQQRNVFLASSIYQGWINKREQLFSEDCAKKGLAQYNAQNGTNFELDKISYEDQCICPGVRYYHLNFIAESSDGSNDEKKRCMFFAEAVLRKERMVVSVCCILDPVTGMDSGCLHCVDRVYHPTWCNFHGCRPT